MMTDFYNYMMTGVPTCDYEPKESQTYEECVCTAIKKVLGFLIGFFVFLLLCAIFCSCSTSKELHEHHVRTIVADMLAEQAQHDTHLSNESIDIDSLVKTLTYQYSAEWFTHEDEKETTTETITTAIDSLGRQLRTEQRTTTRTLSRDEQQRQQQWQQQMEEQWQRRYDRQDSLYRALESRVADHWADSTAQQKNLVKHTDTTTALSWWQRTWAWLRGVLIGIVIAVVVMAARGWLKILKK